MNKRLHQLRRKFQRSIVLVFLFVVLTIALFLKLISVNNADTHSTAQLISHTYNITRYAVTIQATLAETESSIRGYLLTADPGFREAAIRSHEKARHLVTEVAGLVKDPAQKKRIAEISKLVNERIAIQRDIIDSDSVATARLEAIRVDPQSRQNTIAINELIGLFKDRQSVLLDQRTHASELANSRAQKTVITGTAIVFLFITGTLFKLNKDIRRRKQAEIDIRESEKKYRLLIEDAGVTIFTCNLTGIFTYVSGKCQHLTGYTSEELTGQRFSMLVDPDWISVVTDEYVSQVSQFWNETTVEFPILTRDGQRKWVEQHGVLMLDELQSPIGYQCVVKDITEKRNQEDQIRESEYRFRTTLERLGDNVWEHDFEKGETYFSETGYDFLGYQPQEFENNVNLWWDSIHTDDRHLVEENDRKYRDGSISEHVLEYRMICKDGTQKWVLDRGAVIDKNINGLPLKILGTHTDITELKIAVEKLRESDQKIRAMLESTREGFYVVGMDYTVQMINDAGVKSLKAVTGKECRSGDCFLDFVRPERKNIFQKIFNNILSGQTEENEVKMVTVDGEIWFQNSYFPLKNEDGDTVAVCMSSKDITERKLTENALNKIRAEREEYQFRLQSILDNTPLIIFVKDTGGRYLLVNKSFRETIAMPGTDVIGKTDFEIDEPGEAARYKKSDEEVINTLQSFEYEERIKGPQGTRHLLLVKFPLFDKNGTIYGVGCIATDFTEKVEDRQKLIEARKKAESAEQLQEQFLANMSHEIRTPLNGIIGMTNVLVNTELNNDQKEFVDIIRQSSDNLLYLINDVLDLSKIKSGKLTLEHTTFRLEDIVKNTLAPFYLKAKEKNIELQLIQDLAIPAKLDGDPYRLNQVLNNLLSNALKFTERGTVSLAIKNLQQVNDVVTIQFTVTDSGIGIPAEKLTTIFNSFEQASNSTTRRFGGTGLGLAISKQLVEIQGGAIGVHSVLSHGTTFWFNISYKVVEDQEKIIQLSTTVAPGTGDFMGKKILVVEDNEVNQKVILHILKSEGIKVTIANNGREAVNLLEQGATFDLIIMDLQMPEMDGMQTTVYIRSKINKTVPIIAMTASALRNERQKCMELGMNEYLTKPFAPADLFARLRYCLFRENGSETPVVTDDPVGGNTYYDLAFLDEMDDVDYSCDVLQLFLDTTPVLLSEMKEALLCEQWETLYQSAHKLKSSLGILQMNELLEQVTSIEQQAKNQRETERIPVGLKTVTERFSLIRPMIEAELSALRSRN